MSKWLYWKGPVLPPAAANLQIEFDARSPGVGNVPVNLGISGLVGTLVTQGTGHGWTAAGGPANGPRWYFNSTGYYRDALGSPGSSGTLIGTAAATTIAVIVRTDRSRNTATFSATVNYSTQPGLYEGQDPAYDQSSHQYHFSSIRVPASGIPTDVWDVVIMRSRYPGITYFPNADGEIMMLPLGNTALSASNDQAVGNSQQLGSKIDFGGSWATNETDGDIARVMCWDHYLNDTQIQELIDYINEDYGL